MSFRKQKDNKCHCDPDVVYQEKQSQTHHRIFLTRYERDCHGSSSLAMTYVELFDTQF